jgi:hypothetical protein
VNDEGSNWIVAGVVEVDREHGNARGLGADRLRDLEGKRSLETERHRRGQDQAHVGADEVMDHKGEFSRHVRPRHR